MRKYDLANIAVLLAAVIGSVISISSELSVVYSHIDSIAKITILGYPVILTAFAAFFSIYLYRKNKQKDRIFISYSAKDRDKAIEIASKIKNFGYKTWLDIDEILPGQNISDETKKGIEKSSVFLVIVSENYNLNFAEKEFELAMSMMRSSDKTFIPILPIIIKDTPISSIPKALRLIQWLDLRENEEAGYKKLKYTLDRIFNKDS